MSSLDSTIKEKLWGKVRCYGHCDGDAGFRYISGPADLTAVVACNQGYVSRIIGYFTGDVDAAAFMGFIRNASGMDVTPGDVRVATRHSWEMGLEDTEQNVVLREMYWTQNYGRAKSEDPARNALFICGRCGSLFVQSLAHHSVLCTKCGIEHKSSE